MKKYFKFMYVFFLIGLESLGNMSAVMTILEDNLVKKNNYVDQSDIIDAVTISRIGPGATTANAVAYLGNRIAGFWGGVVSTICYTLAPMLIIIFLYGFLEKVLEYNFVKSAINGTLIYICILFINSSYDMTKNIIVNKFNLIILVCVIGLELLFSFPYVWIIIAMTIIGIVRAYFIDL